MKDKFKADAMKQNVYVSIDKCPTFSLMKIQEASLLHYLCK